VDVDLPDILRYKTDELKNERTKCAYEAVYADLREPDTAGETIDALLREFPVAK